jgi:hypothetical protein
MFFSKKNKEILVQLVNDFPNLQTNNITYSMKEFYSDADKSLSLVDLNKAFLLYLQKDLKPVQQPKVEVIYETVTDEVSKNMAMDILLEISLMKQEMSEIKKMLLIVTQLINNFTVAKNSDLG